MEVSGKYCKSFQYIFHQHGISSHSYI
jgi:hypothetical protein